MKETILSRISGWIDENSAILADANNAIWEFAETAFNEKCSSAYLKQHPPRRRGCSDILCRRMGVRKAGDRPDLRI